MKVDIHGAKYLVLHLTETFEIHISASVMITWGLMIILTSLAAWATHSLH